MSPETPRAGSEKFIFTTAKTFSEAVNLALQKLELIVHPKTDDEDFYLIHDPINFCSPIHHMEWKRVVAESLEEAKYKAIMSHGYILEELEWLTSGRY